MKTNENVKAQQYTWGTWINRRIYALGFHSQNSFTHAVGCSLSRLHQWIAMPTPPKQMRKNFPAKLAAALRTDVQTLFTDYPTIDPTTLPLAPVASLALANSPGESEELWRRELRAMVEMLNGEPLRKLRNSAKTLLNDTATV